MWNAWRALVLVSLSIVHNTWTSPMEDSLSDQISSSIQRGIEIFNKGQDNKLVFQLLKIHPDTNLDILPHPAVLHFTIKETVCLKSEKNLMQECPFKDDGVMKICSLHISEEREMTAVSCDTIAEQESENRSVEKEEEEKPQGPKERRRGCRQRPGGCSVIGFAKQKHIN